MAVMLDSIYKGYFLGGLVEKPVESWISHTFKDIPGVTLLQKTAAKVSLCWLGFFLVAAGTLVLTIAVAPPFALGFLGLVCFCKPLFFTTKEYFQEIPSDLSTYQKIAILFSITIKFVVQSIKDLGSTFITTCYTFGAKCKRLWENPRVDLVIDVRRGDGTEASLREQCQQFKDEIKDLKVQVQKIDEFIKRHPDLLQIIIHHIKVYGCATSTPVNIKVDGPDDWLGRRATLEIELLNWKFELSARQSFIISHQAVRERFAACLETERKKGRPSTDSQNLPNFENLKFASIAFSERSTYHLENFFTPKQQKTFVEAPEPIRILVKEHFLDSLLSADFARGRLVLDILDASPQCSVATGKKLLHTLIIKRTEGIQNTLRKVLEIVRSPLQELLFECAYTEKEFYYSYDDIIVMVDMIHENIAGLPNPCPPLNCFPSYDLGGKELLLRMKREPQHTLNLLTTSI